MNKQASTLRSKITKEEVLLFSSFSDKKIYINSSIQGTLFERYVQSSDVDTDVLCKFSVNANVTKKIVDDLIPNITSLDDFFFISKIVEQGYFKLVSSFEQVKMKNNLAISKEFGAFYTPVNIAREMAEAAVLGSNSKVIIDPCAGTGNLLAACLEYASINNVKLERLIGIEIDDLSCKVAKRSLNSLCQSLGQQVDIEIINGDCLDILSEKANLHSSSIPSGTIIINPPYGKVKFESDRLKNEETKFTFNKKHSYRKRVEIEEKKAKITEALGSLSAGKGSLEWSKVLLTLCLNQLGSDETLVYIGPCGWLNSSLQKDIRAALVKQRKIQKIHYLSETATGFETVNQPLAIVNIKTSNQRTKIELISDFKKRPSLKYQELEKLSHFGYPIPRVAHQSLYLFIKMQSFKKIATIAEISNLRGEIDQSIDKYIFTNTKTKFRIIRGENIGRFSKLSIPAERTFYADVADFEKKYNNKPKGDAYKSQRIVCRQCSYMKQKRRLVFSLIPKNCLVGNSCNYIETRKEDAHFYLGLLNSALMDWYFRVLNGNNHVANYEIDDFPIPSVSEVLKSKIEKQTRRIVSLYSAIIEPIATSYIDEESTLDFLVFKAFGLSVKEAELVLRDSHSEAYITQVLGLLKSE